MSQCSLARNLLTRSRFAIKTPPETLLSLSHESARKHTDSRISPTASRVGKAKIQDMILNVWSSQITCLTPNGAKNRGERVKSRQNRLNVMRANPPFCFWLARRLNTFSTFYNQVYRRLKGLHLHAKEALVVLPYSMLSMQ